MLNCAGVYTYEIDDPEAAFTEIKTQLDEKLTLPGHSAGIVMCRPEFKFDSDDILSTSLREIEQINTLQNLNGALLFSCVVRRIVLSGGNKPLSEQQIAKDTIKPDIPFMMGCSGGEICPTSIRKGIPVNRFHNYYMVILVI